MPKRNPKHENHWLGQPAEIADISEPQPETFQRWNDSFKALNENDDSSTRSFTLAPPAHSKFSTESPPAVADPFLPTHLTLGSPRQTGSTSRDGSVASGKERLETKTVSPSQPSFNPDYGRSPMPPGRISSVPESLEETAARVLAPDNSWSSSLRTRLASARQAPETFLPQRLKRETKHEDGLPAIGTTTKWKASAIESQGSNRSLLLQGVIRAVQAYRDSLLGGKTQKESAVIAANSSRPATTNPKVQSADELEIDADKLATDPEDDPYYRKLQREKELWTPLGARLQAIGNSIAGQETSAIYAEFEKAKKNDRKLAKYEEAYQKRIKQLAESKEYDWLAHYRQYAAFASRDTVEQLNSHGITAMDYWRAQSTTAEDVYNYRTRNFGSASAHSRDSDWSGAGHETKEQAKEGFGVLPAARGTGYAWQDVDSLVSGMVGDPRDEAKAELARRELEIGALHAGSGIVGMGVNGKRWYERNMPWWLGGKAGNWFSGADDFKDMSDGELAARRALDYKLGSEIPEALKVENFTPTLGDQSDYKEVVKRAGGELKANLSGLRFGEALDKDGRPIPLESGANRRTADVGTAASFASIPPFVFNNPATRALGGAGLTFSGAALSKVAGGIPKALSAAAAKSGVRVVSASALLQSLPIVAASANLGKRALQLVAKVGDWAKEAGSELLSRVPKTGQPVVKALTKETMQSIALGASSALPMVVTAESPGQALSFVLGGALFGATEAPKIIGRELWTRAAGRGHASAMLEQFGAVREYGLGLDTQHAEAMNSLSPQEQAAVNRLRGFFGNSQTPEAVPIQIYVLKSAAFREQLAKQEPNLSTERLNELATSRGFKSKDGSTIFINARDLARPGQAADAMHHEAGHTITNLAEIVMPDVAKALQSHMAEALYQNGAPTKEFADFARRYGAALKQDLNLNSLKDRARMEQEFLAETMRSILQLRGIGDFAVPKSLQERLKNGFESFLSKRLGIRRPARTLEEFNWTEVPTITRKIEELLFHIGADVPNTAPIGPRSASERNSAVGDRPAPRIAEQPGPRPEPHSSPQRQSMPGPTHEGPTPPLQSDHLIQGRERLGEAFSRLKPKEKMALVGLALGKSAESVGRALGLTAKGTMIAFQVGIEKIIRSLKSSPPPAKSDGNSETAAKSSVRSETQPHLEIAPGPPKASGDFFSDSSNQRITGRVTSTRNDQRDFDPFQRIPSQNREGVGEVGANTLFMPENQQSFRDYAAELDGWAAREQKVERSKTPRTSRERISSKQESNENPELPNLAIPKYDRLPDIETVAVILHPAFDRLSIVERDVWYSMRRGEPRKSIAERLPLRDKTIQELLESAEKSLRVNGALDSNGRPTTKHAQNRVWDDVNFGELARKYYGDPPEDMIGPHGHHILYKEGLSGRQKLLVKEGQEILRRYGIDPIFGKENLCWAPMRAKGQHDIVALRKLVNSLKKVEANKGNRDAIVNTLKKFGEIAKNRQ